MAAQLKVAPGRLVLQHVAMRPAPVLASGLVVVLLAAGVWFTLAGTRDDTGPPRATRRDDDPRVRAAPPPMLEREQAPGVVPTTPTATSQDRPIAPPTAERAETPANVDLRVRTIAGHQDVGTFTWRFRGGADPLRGDGQDGVAHLHLPPGGKGQLLVESPGFAPFTVDLTAPTAEQPPTTIDTFLAQAARAAGITLLVRDTALQPIAKVRVDAFPLVPGSHDGAWQLGASLWARRSEAADGRYELPDLAPGDYGIRVLALDPDGKLLPLLPYLHTFVLTGSSGYVEEVVLEPGCVPEFDLLDATGAQLDPQTAGGMQLRLHVPGGEPVPRMWTVEKDGRTTAALDTLPGQGVVSLAQPVPAGTYALEVTIAGQQRVQQFVTLRAGERQRERIVVR